MCVCGCVCGGVGVALGMYVPCAEACKRVGHNPMPVHGIERGILQA